MITFVTSISTYTTTKFIHSDKIKMYEITIPVPPDIDDIEEPDVNGPISAIEWSDSRTSDSDEEDTEHYVAHQRLLRRLRGTSPGIRNPLEHRVSVSRGPLLSITHNGTDGDCLRNVFLTNQTCVTLTKFCSRIVGCAGQDIQIYYWNPLFRCWTEARASGSLDLTKKDVRDSHIVQGFVLRPWEKAADLPFMKVHRSLLVEVVPVKGRRDCKFANTDFGEQEMLINCSLCCGAPMSPLNLSNHKHYGISSAVSNAGITASSMSTKAHTKFSKLRGLLELVTLYRQ